MSKIEYRRILVPTDFSEIATGALEWAKLIAVRAGSEIDVLYADPFIPPPYFTSAHVDEEAQSLRRSRELAVDELHQYTTRHIPRMIPSHPAVVEDLPVPAIVRWSAAQNIDLVVMGTHGRSGLNRMMLGSVTERVIRESRVPVLAVRPDPKQEQDVAIRRILCPVNFTGVAQAAIDHASRLAHLLQAELTLLHVSESDTPEVDLRAEMDRCVVEPQVDVRRMVLHGSADEKVIEYATEQRFDLIVLGAQHRRFFDTSVLGATTVHVLRHSSTPVLTVFGGK